jgi:hypothetical protein
MSEGTAIDGGRLIKIASALVALASAALVFFATEPALGALEVQADEARATLRSDAVVLGSDGVLRAQRYHLKRRFAHLFQHDAEGVFLGDADGAASRHGTSIVSVTTATVDGRDTAAPRVVPFGHADLTLQFRGAYGALLETIADVSRGREIVAVRSASIRREGDALIATVPVTLYDPAASTDERASGERMP